MFRVKKGQALRSRGGRASASPLPLQLFSPTAAWPDVCWVWAQGRGPSTACPTSCLLCVDVMGTSRRSVPAGLSFFSRMALDAGLARPSSAESPGFLTALQGRHHAYSFWTAVGLRSFSPCNTGAHWSPRGRRLPSLDAAPLSTAHKALVTATSSTFSTAAPPARTNLSPSCLRTSASTPQILHVPPAYPPQLSQQAGRTSAPVRHFFLAGSLETLTGSSPLSGGPRAVGSSAHPGHCCPRKLFPAVSVCTTPCVKARPRPCPRRSRDLL